MGATLYQNVKDPKAHGLSATDTTHQMWIALNVKFNRSSEVLKGLAFKRLHSAKLAKGRDMPAHLDELARLHAEVSCVGGRITDPEMNSIILQSLPPLKFAGNILNLQRFSITFELTNELRTYWDLVHKKEVEAVGNGGMANVFATIIGNGVVCGNCPVGGHSKETCWAHGGGREGQAPHWWVAPAGMELRQQLVKAAKAARTAKWNTKKAATATVAAAQTPLPAAPVPTPIAAPAPTLAFTSPMAIYALGTWTYDKGVSRTCSSVADNNVLPRFGCGESVAPVLNEDIIRTVPDVVVEPPSIYATDTLHAASPCYTFLDSVASEPCVVN
jgi:hypothetical protein